MGRAVQRQIIDSRNITLVGYLDQLAEKEQPEKTIDAPIILE
jgi:hypothetical protein